MRQRADAGMFDRGRLALFSLLLASMLTLMGGAAVAPALPLIQEHFSDAFGTLSTMAVTLPSLAVALTGWATGWLADRFGKVRVLASSLIVFTAAGVSGFLLDDLGAILAMRFVLGVGIGGLSAAVTALIAESYAGASRVRVLGYQSAAMGIGALVLESCGGVLAGFGWRTPFLVYLAGLPVLALCVLSLREPGRVVCGDDPVRTRADAKVVVSCCLAMFLCQMIFSVLPTRLPSFLEDPGVGMGTAAVGLLLGLSGAVNAAASLAYRRVTGHVRPGTAVAAGFAAMGAGMVLLMLHPSVWTAATAVVLGGAGMGTVTPAVTSTLAAQSSQATSGRIMGGFSVSLNLGQFSVSLVTVPILAVVGGSVPDLVGMLGIMSLAVAAAVMLVSPRLRGKGTTAEVRFPHYRVCWKNYPVGCLVSGLNPSSLYPAHEINKG
ncbi:MAG: MFS transporter [Thermoplasmata archaeon]|nr:MFS transporter [Thermoplasmata archaeon]